VGGNVAAMIMLKFGESTILEVKALMAAGLVLFLVTLVVNSIADFIVDRTGKSGR
jgi:phosphate transport system permease protein